MAGQRQGEVAVIIAAWNAEMWIERCVRSALQAGVAEVAVVDDASQDDTAGAARRADDGSGRLRVLRRERNGGPSAARNDAIAATTAPWLAVVDSDDFLIAGRFERLLAEAGDVDIVADGLLQVTAGAEDADPRPVWAEPPPAHRLGLAEFVRANVSRAGAQRQELGFLKPMMRRSFLDMHRLAYREEMRLGEDYELYVRALAQGARFLLVPPKGYVAVVRSDSLAGRHSEDDLQRLRDCDLALQALPGLDADARAALKAHSRSVDCRLQWRRLISAVKRRDVGAALATFARPGPVPAYLLARLGEQAVLRLARRVVGGTQRPLPQRP